MNCFHTFLFYLSRPKRCRRFSLLVSLDVHRFESASLENAQKRPIRVVFLFLMEFIVKIHRLFELTLLKNINSSSLIQIKFTLF